MPRIIAFVAVLAVLIAFTVVVGTSGGAYSTESPVPPNLSADLIAFVNVDGKIHLVRPDGSAIKMISPDDGVFTWPTWSPDGTRVAYSGIPDLDDARRLTLYISDVLRPDTETVYKNEPGMGPILQGMPHYLLWSPDATRLSFMASVPQGLTLFLYDPESRDEPNVVLRESPLYASWSSDSRYMMVHAGIDHFLVDAASSTSVQDNTIISAGYRAPAWLPATSRATFLAQDSRGVEMLYTASVEEGGGGRELMEEYSGNVAFLWSPNGASLAVAQSAAPGTLIYTGVSLISQDGTQNTMEVEENLIAYFWAPDSTKLAYVTVTGTRGVLRWMIFDVTTGDTWPLTDFTPSAEQFTIFQFFDQFAYSHSPWSPDSGSLVFSGTILREGVSASISQQPSPGIYVTDVGPQPLVRRIADGFLGMWSPN